MARFSALILLALLAAVPAKAAPPIAEIAYPAGKTFADVTQESIIPFFAAQFKTKAHFADTPFALFHALPPSRRQFITGTMGLDVTATGAMFAGATMDYAADRLALADGTDVSLPNRTVAQRLAVGYAAYDNGLGLMLDFTPLPYKVYYAPMSRTHLRAYTLFPDGTFFDKTYDDLCRELKAIRDPNFYATAIDFAIRGDFAPVSALPTERQAVIVDLVSIAIAEHHLMVNSRPGYAKSSTGPFYNLVIDTLFYNHGGWQLAGTPQRPVMAPGRCAYFLDDYTAKSDLNALNARLLTQTLSGEAVATLADQTGADTLHEMVAFFMEHPERYDVAMQRHVRDILAALPQQVPAINQALANYKGN